MGARTSLAPTLALIEHGYERPIELDARKPLIRLKKVGEPHFASWNQLEGWLRQVEVLRTAA